MTDIWCNLWGSSLIFGLFSRNFALANDRVEGPVKLGILFIEGVGQTTQKKISYFNIGEYVRTIMLHAYFTC